uniref:Pentatricopeptide repeat-containing protein At1g74850ic n=1 Tax=Rhizophora mucronata TaxID=61149 RepID=A0A2P2JP00_RHIMU
MMTTQTALVMSSVLVLVVPELLSLFWVSLTSIDVLGREREMGELFKTINLSFLVPSETDSMPDKIRLSWERWQVIRPLFHPGKENDGDALSWRNE